METKALSWEELFRKIGLSKYEAKIYIALAIRGPTEARKLSVTSGVPRTKVYSTLKKLLDRGLIIETLGEPKQFVVTSPNEAFNIFIDSLKNDLSERVTSLVELEDAIRVMEELHKRRQLVRPTTSQFGDVWFIEGRGDILRRIEEILSAAEKSVDCVTSANGLILFYKVFNKLLDRLVRKNVNVRIKAPARNTNGSLVRELRYAYKVEHALTPMPMLFVCVDQRELVLVELRPDNFELESGKDCGFFSQNRMLCTFFSALYGFSKRNSCKTLETMTS